MISKSPFDGGSRGLNPCRVTILNPDTLICVRVLLLNQFQIKATNNKDILADTMFMKLLEQSIIE